MMQILGVFFVLGALRILISVSRKVGALLAGALAPHTFRNGVILVLGVVFSLALLNTARLLFSSRTSGIRWGFICLLFEAALWITGNFLSDVFWVVAAAGALWWSAAQVSNQSDSEGQASPP